MCVNSFVYQILLIIKRKRKGGKKEVFFVLIYSKNYKNQEDNKYEINKGSTKNG